MIISLDTETTGVDFAHGVMPFLVTTWGTDGPTGCWEWDVDPLTRKPNIPLDELADIVELVNAAEVIYLHNAKFDVRALATVGIELPWSKVRDTLAASHLLASNHGHRLDQLTIEYLDKDIEKFELHVEKVVKECRKIAKRDYPHWNLADEGKPDMPSVKAGSKREEDKPWKCDMWLPRALGAAGCRSILPDGWSNACAEYANADSEHTLYLGLELERRIREDGWWKIYEHRLHLPRVACEMEQYGITARGDYTEANIVKFEEHCAEAADALVGIAAEFGHELQLADGAALNDNMRDFFYGAVEDRCPRCCYTKRVKHWNGEGQAHWLEPPTCPKCAKSTKRRAGVKHQLVRVNFDNLKLPVIISEKTHNATLDGSAMQEYLATTDGAAHDFIKILLDRRQHETAIGYMQQYRRFWVPVPGATRFFRIHCSLNPFATDHLRWGSNSPNMQNVSSESKKELSNRACFGPLPDREWWDMDFRQIERRIPAYECKEPKLVEVFEKSGPPYWNSLYLLTASVLYPDEFWPLCEVEELFRKEHPGLYKRAKFCDLAKQYGCGRKKYERLARVDGAFDMIDKEFPLLAANQDYYLKMAMRTGWVQTLPDRTVDPERGYPILASRTEDGGILSTTPYNYHVSGTACWVKNAALIRCADQCAKWRAEGFDAHVILEVHDSLLFDFPRGRTIEENLPRAMVLKDLMEQGGRNLIPAMPLPVKVEYITESWASGVAV